MQKYLENYTEFDAAAKECEGEIPVFKEFGGWKTLMSVLGDMGAWGEYFHITQQ